MRILITGGLGFIGSNFILHFHNKYPEFKLTNVDAKLAGSNTKNLIELQKHRNYSFIHGNINNPKLMDRLISKMDVVFNFAAESHVDRSIQNPKPFINSNILGVYTILESVRKYKKKLIHISTDEVFGSLKSGSATEESSFNPSSPYASSKAAAELIIKPYFTTFNSDVMITRCTNNYGPRQLPEKLIPKIILLAERNQKIPIYGTGKNIRDWIHVFDHCEGIIKVFEKGKSGESYNIAGHNETSNNIIVKKILEIMGKSSKLIEYVKDRPGHDFRYSLDSSKIETKLNWKPKHTFEKGLKQTIEWYQKNQNWWKNFSTKFIQINFRTLDIGKVKKK